MAIAKEFRGRKLERPRVIREAVIPHWCRGLPSILGRVTRVVHGAGILHTSLAACLVLLLGIMVGFCRILRPTPNHNTIYGSPYSRVSFRDSISSDFHIFEQLDLPSAPPNNGEDDQGGH